MTTPLRAYVAVDPWDLIDEGIDHVLDRISGEITVDGIQVTAVAGTAHVFRPHADASPRTYQCRGAAFFQPEARRYAGSRLRPIIDPSIKSRNPLEQLAAACRKRGLALRVRVSACDSIALVERHPFAACKDVFGDASPARICPSNPDVRAYLAALVEDLSSNYEVEALDLADVDYGEPEHFHRGRLNPVDPAEWRPTVLCFCESCRQAAAAAGVPIEDIADEIRTDPRDVSADEGILRGLHDLRSEAVTKLVTAGCAATEGECWLELRAESPHCGHSGNLTLAPISGVLVKSPITAPDEKAREYDESTPRSDYTRICLIKPVGYDVEIPAGAATVVRSIVAQAGFGARRFIFNSYGTMPDERFDWVRQAIRFARRDTGG